MNALHRLQFQLMQDEFCERWQRFLQQIRSFFPQRQHRVGISLAEVSQESEGRVWVEVGNEGLKVRVTHLHPANPSIAEALIRKCNDRRENHNSENCNLYSWLTGKLIYPPEDDKISLSSLEDYWFNHWQGPFISADNNQNSYSLSKLRRSHRKSRRTNRCSICHKKRVATEGEDKSEGSILAHMPSVKFEARVIKEDPDEKSDDETSEDAISRYSASDEHFGRAHRILDNELRTSFSLFADEAVSQDVIDSSIRMSLREDISSPDGSNRFYSSLPSPRQSQSCPCSPKLTSRTYSPESISNSPKSSSFVNSSKFSLSSSLLAIHRQASNTFIPEFLKFDNNKSDSPGASKANSQQNSLRSQNKRHQHYLSDTTETFKDEGLPSKLECQTYPIFPHTNDTEEQLVMSSKRPLTETQSLPTLKLSKMALTYRGGIIISEEKEEFDNEDLEECSNLGAVALPITLPESSLCKDTIIENQGMLNIQKLLPDVIPIEINSQGLVNLNEFETPQEGVINLGFDGTQESSDFTVHDHSILDINVVNSSNITNSSNQEDRTIQLRKQFDKQSESYGKAANDESSFYTFNGQGPTSCNETNEQFGPMPNVAEESLYNTFVEKDVMQEARDVVFWWRKKSLPTEEELEFCLHEAECKVKQKPLLLFLHGIGSSADVWNQQLWYFLSCGYEVVAPDLLGHGMSSAPKDKKYYSFASMLDYVSLVFDLFVPQGRKCIVIGHNYGCALAVALARGRPLSVGLVVLASCGGPSPLAPYTKYESSLNSWVTRLLNPYIACGCLSRELLYTPRGKHFMPVISDEKGVPSSPPYVVDNISSGQYWPEGDLAFHRRITIPVLLLHGMKDNSVSFVEMCEMEKTIPRAFLELIPGAGHELMTDAAEEVCHAIHRFIRRWKNHI